MSSKFARQFQIPPEFPDILKDFTREVLRNQPANITEFGAKYFDCLAQGLPGDMGATKPAEQAQEPELSLDEVEAIIQDLFNKYDKDTNRFLDPNEFKSLMNDLQQRLEFPKDEVLRFLAEADMNADGMIEYEEFIPLALQIIQSMYAKRRLEQHIEDVEQHAEDLLVHGMSRAELTELVGSIFERMDQDGSGFLSKQEFVTALTSMELGLTRREINTIMFQIDQDSDGMVSYREFVPFAFDLLQKLTSMRLLETELENDELSQYLNDLFKAKDTEGTGMLHTNDIRDLLHEAMLGLSRMQIFTVISEAETNTENKIAYATFIPRAVGLIRSMLSFEKSIVKESEEISAEAEQTFASAVEEAFQGEDGHLPLEAVMEKIAGTNLLSQREKDATKAMLLSYGDAVPVQDIKGQIWTLVRNMRRQQV
mmetsp:Transcript_19840/g.46124  ORF Transcript_19840/g.46124 Transcript_19840/m.46124 type:complete len:425 (+) Transcript_19840:93-1367(+)